MEYGYEITDTAGNMCFFVEGCTYCSMGTGGLHEQHCPLSKQRELVKRGLEDIEAGRYKSLKDVMGANP